MSDAEFVLTRGGFDDIQRELNEILTIKRPQVIERIRQARQVSDPAENSEYEEAKRLQAILETRVKELKAIISHASVIDAPLGNGSIGIGSRVVVRDTADGAEDEYIIVSPAESSPALGKISHESIVGSALMGMKTGDKVLIETPGGMVQYEIVSVK